MSGDPAGAALDSTRSVVVEACAGSGKTWLLVSRILRLLLDGAEPSQILAITFTRKASVEMATRLRQWLRELACADDATVAAMLAERGLDASSCAAVLPRAQVREGLDAVYQLFPRLLERRHSAAGWLSGGEQQMLALGRALIGRPQMLLIDELSLGLAPLIVKDIYQQLRVVGQTLGTAMLVVEQNARLALEFAASAYILNSGRVVLSGTAAEVSANDAMKESYLGTQRRDGGAEK
jgi:ABC-type branched-subunit amino acid transport system ATPase component